MIQIGTPALARGGKGRFQNNDDGNIQKLAPSCNAPEVDDPHRRFVLSWLRCLHNRVSMFGTEIDTIGVALRGGLVSPEGALDWLDELDPILLALIGAKDDVQ